MGNLFGGGDRTTTQKVEIPGFLKPFIRQGVGVGGDALEQLQGLLGPGSNLFAPMSSQQDEALRQAEAVAGGAGGFIPTAQDALMSTARGDFLFGGPGFDEAVQASIRAAQPSILSSFGRSSGLSRGLGPAAVQGAASDAFARLFSQERSNQLSAAGMLPEIGLAGSNILSNVGAQRQQEAQRGLEGPVATQERLLRSALGITPSQSGLFGQSVTQPNTGNLFGQILGGGLTLAGLGGGGKISPRIGMF